MKKRILTLGILAMLAFSCQDAYNVDQPGTRTEDSQIFNTPAEVEKGINGLYNSLPGESEIEFVSYFTDELGVGRDNLGQGTNDGSYKFFMVPGNSFAAGYWTSLYNIVNRGNRLLHRIDELKAISPNDEALYNTSRARILALRAYAHMKLFAYFTPDYTNQSGLSIIKFDFYQTDDYKRYEKRATVKEIVDFIQSDIDEALSLGINGSDNIYVTDNFAHAVLVKLYAMTGNVDELMANFNAISGQSIGDALNFSSTFSTDESLLSSNPDIIFRLSRLVTDSQAVAGAWYSGRVTANPNLGSAYMEIGRSLYNELDKLDPDFTGEPSTPANGGVRKDLRYNTTVLVDGSKPQANYASLDPINYKDKDLLFIGKYPGVANSPLQNDIKVFRYTDMLLAKAEGLAINGDVDGVVEIITQIRNARVYPGTTPTLPAITDVTSAWKAILDERRLEFAFEGHRYLDMKRLGRKANSPGFVRDAKDCETNGACSLEATSYKLTLPIPSVETQSNPNIRPQQNPGY